MQRQLEAGSFQFVVVGEQEFESLQLSLAEGDRLSETHATMLAGLAEPTTVSGVTHTPVRSSTVEPRVATLEEFRQTVGRLEYINYMRTMAGLFEPERSIDLNQRFTDHLERACDSRQEELLSEACAAGDSEACQLVDNLDQLDPAIVAEACELTPYMLFCDPEDPIPWELPPLEE